MITIENSNNYMMEISNSRLSIHFDTENPIELTELTLSFMAISRQYKKFISKTKEGEEKKEARLYITKIENNCIIAELAPYISTILASANTIVEFSSNLADAINFFYNFAKSKGKKNPQDIPYDKTQCEDLAKILDVVTKSDKDKLALKAIKYTRETENAKTLVEYNFDNAISKVASEGAHEAIALLTQKHDNDYYDVLLYYKQANTDELEPTTSGHKVIITAISPEAMPVYFQSLLDRQKMSNLINDPSINIFKTSFRADVRVEVNRFNEPQSYRILQIKEIIQE